MAPRRKSKSVNKRFTNEASPEIYFRNSSKTKQRKKKLTDKLGSHWTRGELERFYDAYRKHAGDWTKVAAAVRNNRSVDMVETLFYMNRAYLSLPEGTASVAGLIAMMADHYSVIEGSQSEGEGEGHNASVVSSKHQKRKRAKIPPGDLRGEVIPPMSISSAEGCLSFLKQTQAYGIERRATGKRTPRFPVPSTCERDDREGFTPSNKRAKKQIDADDDNDAYVVALTFTDASRKRGGSPYRRTELSDSTPIRLGKMSQTKEAQYENHDTYMFENGVRISRDRRHKKGTRDRDGALLMDMEGIGTMKVPQKGKNVGVEEAEGNDYGDSEKACRANEGLRFKRQKGIVDFKASRDELEALEVLTGLSALLLPADLLESESSMLKEERMANNVDDKSNTPETVSTSHHRGKAKQAGAKYSVLHAISAAENRKPKSMQESVDGNAASIGELGISKRKRKPKVVGVEGSKDSIQNKSLYNKELAEDDDLKRLRVLFARPAGKGPAKQLKTAKTLEKSSSTSDKKSTGPDAVVSAIQVPVLGPASLPQKPPHRRKLSLKKSLQERTKSSETTQEEPHSFRLFTENELLKEKVSTCLSYPLVRRRCIFEWFYSAIDYPWFAKMEFIDYLNHVGLVHVPRLTRLEWSIIKSSLGRPRTFSERFLQEERDKLKQYRESVRKHYTELRAGAREELRTDLARPLSVGNRVIAIHPKTREFCDGKILTVGHNKCNVLFDEFGVELVMDIDCMPLNPMEYMAECLRRQTDKCLPINKEAQINRHPNSDAYVWFPLSALGNVSFSMNPPVKQDDINEPISHGKVVATKNNARYITANSKARRTEIQRAMMLQHTSDAQEMEPETNKIVSGSKSIAQKMVDAAIMKATSSSVKKEEDEGIMVQKGLSSVGKHQPLDNTIVPGTQHQEHTNGSRDHHQSRSSTNTAELMTNGFISQEGSEKSETQMPSELITSCVATWLMIQMSTEKQYPPADVAQLMETAVSSLQPRCPQNMPIYREIQTCMGWITTQIMALVRT